MAGDALAGGRADRFDVVIIGAGLAGAAAAEAVAANGLRAIVLEARDRPGGRAFTRAYANTTELMEFGGAWITPWQRRMRASCARHGLSLRPRQPITQRRWLRGGVLRADGPAPPTEQAAHARTLAMIAEHAALLKAGTTRDRHGNVFGELSLNSYLDLVRAPAVTRELLSAWWAVSGSGDKTLVPATELLHSISYFDGTPDGICEVWTDTVADGAQTLVARMLARSGAACHFDATATRITHGVDGVRVRTSAGEFSAAAAVIATGVNPMSGIVFDPPLPEACSAALKLGHLGRAVKVWARVSGIPAGILATGGHSGIEWMFAERCSGDGTAFVVGFGVAANGWQPDVPPDVVRAVERLFPEGRLLDCEWHDWNADPHARGTWVSGRVDSPAAFAASNWSRLGRLAFASSDIASTDAGWFEGAIASGENAAAEVQAALAAH